MIYGRLADFLSLVSQFFLFVMVELLAEPTEE